MYKKMSQAWLQHVRDEPDSTEILSGTAGFLTSSEPLFAQRFLEGVADKEPKRRLTIYLAGARLHAAIGALIVHDPDAKRESARQAMTILEEFSQKTPGGSGHRDWLEEMARATTLAEDLRLASTNVAKLEDFAEGDVPGWTRNNLVHRTHTLRGQLAIISGDRAEAERRLRQSARVGTSPQLSTFGPSTILAQELLGLGVRKAVLEYFDACSEIWAHGRDQLDEWRSAVGSGDKPILKPNVFY
ncbi:MAG: hypothetical protein WD276_10925 [Actinomycetota bacterium]